MEDNSRYEVIWNSDAALDLEEYVVYAKSTAGEAYDKAHSLLSIKPHEKGKEVKFKGFEYNGYRWINVRNIILIFEIFDEEKIVAVEASYFANNARSSHIFYDVDPNFIGSFR